MVDGLNHRVGKKRNGAFEQVFVYDGDRIAAELDGSGNVVSRFVYLSQAHSPDLVVKNDGSSYRLVKDHLGSIRLVVNQTSGAIVQQLDYDAWGNTTIVTDGATPFQPFGFAGGLWDRDTNLVRFGARDYDPATGRWTAKDTWRFGGGELNLYTYVQNAPLSSVDKSGHGVALYLKCLTVMKGAPKEQGQWPGDIIICLPWLAVPDPPSKYPACAPFPSYSLARHLCCKEVCGFDPSNPPSPGVGICGGDGYRTPAPDRQAEHCYLECLSEDMSL